MHPKLQKIAQLAHELPIVVPPGPQESYSQSGITYLVKTEGGNEFLADNPYIIEYLLYNDKSDWIPNVSHMQYLGRLAMPQSKSDASFFVFFNEDISYILDFQISEKELPVFKVFLDTFAYFRKSESKKNNSLFFPWKVDHFLKFANTVTHTLTPDEVVSLHKRLCAFQRKFFPGEALQNLFPS